MSGTHLGRLQLGHNATANDNLVWDTLPDGTLLLRRGTLDAVGPNVVKVDANGNLLGKVPAFSAYLSAQQATTQSAWTKVAVNTIERDTAAAFDISQNRYTAKVAGDYLFFGLIAVADETHTRLFPSVYKNGVFARYGMDIRFGNTSYGVANAATVVFQTYMNGTTDYVELFAFMTRSAGSPALMSGITATSFSGHLVSADL